MYEFSHAQEVQCIAAVKPSPTAVDMTVVPLLQDGVRSLVAKRRRVSVGMGEGHGPVAIAADSFDEYARHTQSYAATGEMLVGNSSINTLSCATTSLKEKTSTGYQGILPLQPTHSKPQSKPSLPRFKNNPPY